MLGKDNLHSTTARQAGVRSIKWKKILGKDETGRRYYWVRYSVGSLGNLPWRKSRFDVGIFVHSSASHKEVEACIREVVRQNNDWILTFGSDSQKWHDCIDRVSVETSRQKRVGDGNPMTAWFDDVRSLTDLDTSRCYGGYTFLLVLVGFGDKETEQIERFKKKLRPDKPFKRDAAKRRRAL